MKYTLDQNEKAFLKALRAVDPDGEFWTAHWAPGLDLEAHGASPVGASYEGSYAVMKNLASRGFLDKESRMNHHTGVCLNDKGKEALQELNKDQKT